MRAPGLAVGGTLLLLASLGVCADEVPVDTPVGMGRWFDPASSPFIPVPEIDFDPYAGTTLGIIPVFLYTDEHQDIRRIIAPDILYNPHFGYGARGRIFDYPSDETQWSVVGGAKERVESEFDAEYATGLSRRSPWSFNARAVYDRSGTPRFFGIGNDSAHADESHYVDQQKFLEATAGWNLTHAWQLAFTSRARSVQILGGSLRRGVPIDIRFPGLAGLGVNREVLKRISLTYDTRDQLTVPSRGTQVVVYAGAAARNEVLGSNLYSVAGLDARQFWPVTARATLAVHFALRYLPTIDNVPFWALSSIGGDRSVIGDEQPLRAFGPGRFVDRNSSSASLEYRRRFLSMGAFSTRVDVELAPFIDVGRVFAQPGADPVAHLHRVAGLGFRGIASPYVVGYVDVGYGSEGGVIFSGINYPF